MAILKSAVLALVGISMAQTSGTDGETSGNSNIASSTTVAISSSSVMTASTSYADISGLPTSSTEAVSRTPTSSEANNMENSSDYYPSESVTVVVSSSVPLSSAVETSTPSGSIVSKTDFVASTKSEGSTASMSTPYANITTPVITATGKPISSDGIVKGVSANLLLTILALTAALQM
ncbi:hypothetical protein NPX13_g123 [Xylaria arbuscula]|uniref:Uncharacterized protein n=1 Tax=Xylaria arbuscula TaxID=114810 RepID=A0A9W8NNT9_9PEZI|nr:hypothetical protein NPX13_g123 [Xylaria arbuscula]